MSRPPKFKNDLPQLLKIAALYGSGATDEQLAVALGIAPRTVANWKKKYPEFLQAGSIGKEVKDEAVVNALLSRALGYSAPHEEVFCAFGKVTKVKTFKHYPPDVSAIIHWLKNRNPTEWGSLPPAEKDPQTSPRGAQIKTFEQFCNDAGYPCPYPKQIEMRDFGLYLTHARLLLGSRGYGKTEYIVIMGLAYELYLHWHDQLDYKPSTLLITKSREKNTAILGEIEVACLKNGVTFDKANASNLRLAGHVGKDNSISAVTIKSKSLRGRHPYRIVMDDPVTEDDTSEATRKHVAKVYNECFKLTDNILVIGQPAHKQDLYASMRKNVKTLEVPHGTIPELDHDLEAQRIAGVDEASIQASYFLKIPSDGSSPFEQVNYLDKYPFGANSVAWIDPSFKGGDYTALTILTQYMQGVAVYGKVWKRAWNHCLDDMIPHLKKTNVKKLCFETNSLGDQPVLMVRELAKKEKLGFGVVGYTSTDNKHKKIMSAGAYAHLIHLSKDSDKVYTDHVVNYEYGASFDDAPDSLASCLKWIGLIR